MTETNSTDDTEARAFEAGLRARMRWVDTGPTQFVLLAGKIRVGDVWFGKSTWWADPLDESEDHAWMSSREHPTREAAQAALVDAAVAAIMGDGA